MPTLFELAQQLDQLIADGVPAEAARHRINDVVAEAVREYWRLAQAGEPGFHRARVPATLPPPGVAGDQQLHASWWKHIVPQV